MIELRYLRPGGRRVIHVVTPVALALSASLLAGCSAGIARFDNPSFAFNDTATGSVDRGSGYGGSNLSDQSPSPDYGRSYTGPVTSTQGVSSTTLPDVAQAPSSYSERGPSYSGGSGERRTAGAGYGAPPSAPYDRAPRQAQDGQTIIVQPGDTLYGLSRRHGVPLSDLMAANGLTGSQLRTGQRLTLPGDTSVASARSYAPSEDTTPSRYPAASSGGSSYAMPAASAETPSNWNGTYTVASGDALYGIARQHGVTASELQRYNDITDPQRLAPGTVLKVPGRSYGSPTFAEQRPEPNQRVAALQGYSRNDASPPQANYVSPPADASATAQPSAPAYAPQARGVRTVSISPPSTQTSDASVASTGKMRWPVRGRVIGNFGPRSDGTHNDGVNLAVPAGAEVHAAEEGVVAYAGSELRGYGNLILLRHSNGWVTAYAHNEEMTVKRGDKVARGQVIAKAGNTGDVDQPQLHFELRMGSKPVDPLPYLETL